MNRIQKVSAFFLIVFKFLLVFLPAFAIFKWVIMDTEFAHNMYMQVFLIESYGNIYLSDLPWSPFAQFLGLCSYIVALLPILISLCALIGIFKNYQQGEIFNAVNARYYRLIGWMFIFDGLFAQIFSGSLLSIAATLNNPPGQRSVSLGFGSPNMEALFCGAVVIVISWVMLEASKLQDDQKYTV